MYNEKVLIGLEWVGYASVTCPSQINSEGFQLDAEARNTMPGTMCCTYLLLNMKLCFKNILFYLFVLGA